MMPFSGACLAVSMVPGVRGVAVSIAVAAVAIFCHGRKSRDRETKDGERKNDVFECHGRLRK